MEASVTPTSGGQYRVSHPRCGSTCSHRDRVPLGRQVGVPAV